MKHKSSLLVACGVLFLFSPFFLHAQEPDEDEFDFSEYETAEVKTYCNNKINNLSPTNLISLSYDMVMPFDFEATPTGAGNMSTTAMGLNHGLRLETNYPVISKSSVILNLYANYWQSDYASSANFSDPSQELAQNLNANPLRSIAVGAVLFKPLNEKHFLMFQFEPSLNGNYNFGELSPDLGKMKYSAAALFGWKLDDNTNIAIGATRTYRGGRLLHIPILLYNKTFNDRWGTELLLPARGSMRYNFSVKSMLLFGYELEGQSYHIQPSDNATFGEFPSDDALELRKSEIRPRIQFRQSITDFIWLDAQAGVRVAYRFDLDENAEMSDALLENNIGVPLYFRIGISLVSP